MTDDDRARLHAITRAAEAGDHAGAASLIREYYRDLDRANRTPRGLLYLHLGIVCGSVFALTNEDPAPELRRRPLRWKPS